MKKKIFIMLLICTLLLTACGKKKENKKENETTTTAAVIEETKEENSDIKIVNLNSNTRPYAVVINNYPAAVKVQTGLQDAYMIYEIPVEGGMSRSLALYKDVYPTKIGTVRSARHNFLDYVMENDAIFVHFGWSHYAQDEMNSVYKIDNINGLYDSPFWRENPEGLATEHTAYTSLESVKSVAASKGYRNTTDVKPILTYSSSEVDLSSDGMIANTVIVPYSSYYEVKFVYDSDAGVYKRYVNNVAHTDYFNGTHFSTKNIIVIKLDFTNTDDGYYLNLYNTGSGKGYYITDGYAREITWEKSDRTAKTTYKYLDGSLVEVNDGNTYIMLQSLNKSTTIE